MQNGQSASPVRYVYKTSPWVYLAVLALALSIFAAFFAGRSTGIKEERQNTRNYTATQTASSWFENVVDQDLPLEEFLSHCKGNCDIANDRITQVTFNGHKVVKFTPKKEYDSVQVALTHNDHWIYANDPQEFIRSVGTGGSVTYVGRALYFGRWDIYTSR